MKLLFLTGSRGEWGYIRPILNLCQEHKVNYSICATNMHLLPTFGSSVDEIRRDGFDVADEIYMALDGYNHYTMTKSMAIMQASFVDVLMRTKPDWLILAGDRGETLMGAIAGAYTYTPVAHIQAGELSGNIDGQARHAIGKFAHIHFASNNDAEQRLLRLGEEAFRVMNVGAPQLDELVQGCYSSRQDLNDTLGTNFDTPYMMVVQHPVTEDFECADQQIAATIEAVNRFSMRKIWIMPNNDAGSDRIRDGILSARKSDVSIFSNLARKDYLGLLKRASCIIGNSSSGLLEAPTFKIPAVNIGRRQSGRMQGENVINTPNFNVDDIVKAIEQATSSAFKNLVKECSNPYGDGQSAERIMDILRTTPKDDKLLVKQLTY